MDVSTIVNGVTQWCTENPEAASAIGTAAAAAVGSFIPVKSRKAIFAGLKVIFKLFGGKK